MSEEKTHQGTSARVRSALSTRLTKWGEQLRRTNRDSDAIRDLLKPTVEQWIMQNGEQHREFAEQLLDKAAGK